jgi:hypothetical protein
MGSVGRGDLSSDVDPSRIPGRGSRCPTTALAVVPLLCLGSAAMFWYGFRFYERDRAAVPVAAGPPAPTRPEHGHP